MKQRRTVTFSQDILIIAKSLTERNRMLFYDYLFNHFLSGENLPNEGDISGELRVALACAAPQIRTMQSKYYNGSTEKKFTEKTQATLCPSRESEIKQNKAEESGAYNNIYPFPKLIYILNKYISTNQSSAGAHAYARDETNKKPAVAKVEDELTKLKSEHPELYQYFYQIIQTIENSGSTKIYGTLVPTNKIIQSICRVAAKPEFCEVLTNAYREASAPNVRDSIKYSISLLYNLGNKPEPSREKRQEFTSRTYTPEEIDNLYNNLDELT